MRPLGIIYLVGVGLIWLLYSFAVRKEATIHGRDALLQMGCVGGFLWPLFLAYLIIASPWVALTWWRTRNER